MAWMAPSISEIVPGLFIGNVASSMNRDILRDNNINAIVSLLNGPYAKWNHDENRQLVPEDRHLFVPCLDSSTMDVLALMSSVCDWIDRHLGTPTSTLPLEDGAQNDGLNGLVEKPHRPGRVLVHCKLGISRSATVVIAYLMRKRHEGLDSVLSEVKKRRNIRPSENFMNQLRVWEAVEYQVWTATTSTVPKELYQAYLDRRAAKLKAKGLIGNVPIVMTSL
ncbi:hypothetical protein G7Z17_g4607 [Cylindrodendrum hubeiense]|uniref:protein-tyrosine-phosphatase n=1 Tax=Cylindrodendrum hubeiense TaxID=595255 RepID=A0A9P5HFS1_9HYPO|nr:hypothetical protein G7Z17_g4607 [Cylindrodendrum hubeiense]